METTYHRQYLTKPTMSNHSCPGFNQHAINRLAIERPSANSLTIETNRIKRDMKKTTKNIVPLLEYQLWLEAGKLDKINFKVDLANPGVTFNSNLWRNFRNSSGLINSDNKDNVSEAVSNLYPINIPSASQVGTHTLSNFFDQNRYNMFKDDRTFNLTVARVENEATFMKFLRLKSELRNPPLDYDGSIIPPKNFRTYPPLTKNPLHKEKSSLSDNDYIYRQAKSKVALPPGSATNNRDDLAASSQIDFNLLDKATNRRFKARTKLTARDNHPDYDKVLFDSHVKKHTSAKSITNKSLGDFKL